MHVLSLKLDTELRHYTKYIWDYLHYPVQRILERLLSSSI